MNKSREQMSAAMDGELDDQSRDRLIDQMLADPALAEEWVRWETARAALHHDQVLPGLDVSRAVSGALKAEPTVLAPRVEAQTSRWRRLGVMVVSAAVAASFALGIMVSTLWSETAEVAPATATAAVAQLKETVATKPDVVMVASNSARPVVKKAVTDKQRLNAYVLAHADNVRHGVTRGLLSYAPVVAMETVDEESAMMNNGDGVGVAP